jgi:hypothetical protein
VRSSRTLGPAKCKQSTAATAFAPQGGSHRLYSGGGLIRLHTYRGKRACAKSIGIALGFLGQCTIRFAMTSFFAIGRSPLRSVCHAFSNAAPIARASNTGKSRTPRTPFAFRRERYWSLSHRCLGRAIAGGDNALLDMMSVPPPTTRIR